MTNKIYAFLLLVYVSTGLLNGQERLEKQDIIRKVNEEYYAEALPLLESQYRKYPKDPDYLFYTGLCRLLTTSDIPGAIALLKESALLGSPVKSWFYLGRAYMLNYQFTDAEEAFSRYNDKGTRDEKEKLKLSMYLTMCRNAQDICTQSKRINVIKIDTISENSLLAYLNKQQINGRLEKIGETTLFSSKDHEGIKFSATGNTLQFQSKYPFGKKQKDIFTSQADDIEMNKFKTLSSPVNSTFDEHFVFFDETAPALYFTSQGHNSAGGYDIFRSYYDKPGNKWSKPENLGFPINTPFDEVAYVTIPGTQKSILVSRRNSGPGKLVVYFLDNTDASAEETTLTSQAREIGHLRLGKQKFNAYSKTSTDKEKPHLKSPNEVPEEIRNEKTYQRLIHDALNLQIRSDSIKRLSDDKKEAMIASNSESEKTKLRQEIKTLDERAAVIQQKADVLYKKAREVEAEKQAAQKQVNTTELARNAFSNKENQPSQHTKKTGETKPQKDTRQNKEKHNICYRIQIGVFSKPRSDEFFKGFSPILKEVVNNGSAIKYYVGKYPKMADAEKSLVKVKEAGFRDAYIIGFYNEKVIPISRAKELELSNQND